MTNEIVGIKYISPWNILMRTVLRECKDFFILYRRPYSLPNGAYIAALLGRIREVLKP